jgi:DNA-directed RNA polymerase subunit E'/Rpb7
VGGLANEEHIDWIDHKSLQAGDEIRVQICDAELVDDPVRKRRTDAAETLDGKKQYVRRIAKELGWKIQTDPDNPDD